MLVASLLLILVAVALLVFGLVDGSSTLLTSSIAASLLAAVALVAGARQAAATRARAAERAEQGEHAGAPRATAPPAASAPSEVPTTYVPTTIGAGGVGWRQPPGPPVADDPVVLSPRPDAGAWEPEAEAPWDPVVVPEPAGPTGRPPATGPVRYAADPDPVPYAAEDTDPDRYDDLPVDASHADRQVDGPDDPAPPWEHPADASSPWEPPLQRVPPADAALVAQLDDEVRVVDGHPRYHLLSCAHLIEREHEPLPVFEAISLGFTPCGLCNPDTALLADTYPR
ncbi:hypothetical protein AWV63_02810 [Micromonospora rifamycinica]|uniref:Uncharacterized protein n=1 Tax=Micromonospora rifamycinica TaxID=291594 RepID=A0A120FA28_9ACTN|nr:hypothetical protein AWV63_02810 [Micromonospora rifamycinica]SCG81083.1 hypothetical protein GA0070623_5456 [Micromonospora rifamycinica]